MQINYVSCVIFFQGPFNLVLLGLSKTKAENHLEYKSFFRTKQLIIEFLCYYKKQTERKKKDHCLILHDAL